MGWVAVVGAVGGALAGFLRKGGATGALITANRVLIKQAIKNQISLVEAMVGLHSAFRELDKELDGLPIKIVGTWYSADLHKFSNLARDTLFDIVRDRRDIEADHKLTLLDELTSIREQVQGLMLSIQSDPTQIASMTAALSAASIADTVRAHAAKEEWDELPLIRARTEDILLWSLSVLKTISAQGFPIALQEVEAELVKVTKRWDDHPLKVTRLNLDYVPRMTRPDDIADNRPQSPDVADETEDSQQDQSPSKPVFDIEKVHIERTLTLYDTEVHLLNVLRRGTTIEYPMPGHPNNPRVDMPFEENRLYQTIIDVKCTITHEVIRWPRFIVTINVSDQELWTYRKWTWDVYSGYVRHEITRADDDTEISTLPTFRITDEALRKKLSQVDTILKQRNALVLLGEFLLNQHEKCDAHIPILEEKLIELEAMR